jgi:hypothetical protein
MNPIYSEKAKKIEIYRTTESANGRRSDLWVAIIVIFGSR